MTDKRCGTCYYWGDHNPSAPLAPCKHPLMELAEGTSCARPSFNWEGTDCPCWTPKETMEEKE